MVGGTGGRNKRNEDVFCSTRFRENALAPAPTHSTCDLTDRGPGGGGEGIIWSRSIREINKINRVRNWDNYAENGSCCCCISPSIYLNILPIYNRLYYIGLLQEWQYICDQKQLTFSASLLPFVLCSFDIGSTLYFFIYLCGIIAIKIKVASVEDRVVKKASRRLK